MKASGDMQVKIKKVSPDPDVIRFQVMISMPKGELKKWGVNLDRVNLPVGSPLYILVSQVKDFIAELKE
jgi:hypothetical protein